MLEYWTNKVVQYHMTTRKRVKATKTSAQLRLNWLRKRVSSWDTFGRKNKGRRFSISHTLSLCLTGQRPCGKGIQKSRFSEKDKDATGV